MAYAMKVANPMSFRRKMRTKLVDMLSEEDDNIDYESIVTNIEKGIFNSTVRDAKHRKIVRKWDNKYFVILYVNKFRSLWNNLKKSKDTLMSQVLSGEKKPHEIAFMNHQEFQPDMWKKLIDEKIVRDKKKYEVDMRGASDEFKCGKCKQRKTSYYQLQTRSADEPMTTFVTCLNCGNHWKC